MSRCITDLDEQGHSSGGTRLVGIVGAQHEEYANPRDGGCKDQSHTLGIELRFEVAVRNPARYGFPITELQQVCLPDAYLRSRCA